MERGEHALGESELARPAGVLAQRFIQRWDAYALQLEDGRYVAIREPLNVGHLYAHLRGEITLGTYLLNSESKARFVVLDNDAADGWPYLLQSGAKLAESGIAAYLEKSRRGGHLWMFFKEPIAGASARTFAQALVEKHGLEGFEIYPKQDEAGKGLGSLIRLPFGIHRLSGNRYGFFAATGEPLGRTLREQIDALQRPQFVSENLLKTYKKTSSPSTSKVHHRPRHESTGPLSERITVRLQNI